MAIFNEKEGTIIAHCPGCHGAKSAYVWSSSKTGEFGSIKRPVSNGTSEHYESYRLFRCGGCGRGGLGVIIEKIDIAGDYPIMFSKFDSFYPESGENLSLPENVPDGIKNEFLEAEKCFFNNCYRAALAMFRSVLDKTMRDNGFKTKEEKDLFKQIEAAMKDGILTQVRKKRAHNEIRVLGNDVLHEEWHSVPKEDVEVVRHYTQRILEDFYDDRETVIEQLKEKGRL
jgi:hypothetical protein